MITTFENLNGGVGMRIVYGVLRNNKHVATIRRFGMRHNWDIESVHYGVKLASAANIEIAKQRAREIVYPTQRELYEQVCARKMISRRAYIEQVEVAKLALLVRELVAGSNSARIELEEMVAAWDRFAADRSDTHEAAKARTEAHNKEEDRYTGKWVYAPHPGSYPYYPEPPSD